jgi:hypothetical protein
MSGENVIKRRLTGVDESARFLLWTQRSGRCKRRGEETARKKEQKSKIWCSRVLFEMVRREPRDGSEKINNTSEPRMAKKSDCPVGKRMSLTWKSTER